jgi:hypothetical protein
MAIGNLGGEFCQDCDPYANIAQRGVLRAQLNSIIAMFPNLAMDKDDLLPRGAKDLGNGFALLHACQSTAELVTQAEGNAILRYWESKHWPNLEAWPRSVKRWARLQLPNGQKAHLRWFESQSTRPLRRVMCVTVCRFLISSCLQTRYSLNPRWLLMERLQLRKSNTSSACNLVILFTHSP